MPLHLHRWSPPRSPAAVLLLLHGLGEHAGQYAPLAEAAAAAGFETWAHDQAGHGRSDGVRVLVESVDDLVVDAEAVLAEARRARPGVPVVVVGHSMGATVAAVLLGEVRSGEFDPAGGVEGLVLAGSSLRGGGLALPPGVDPWELRKDPAELVRDPEQAARVRADPLVWDGGLRRETLGAMVAAKSRTARLVEIGALDHLPVLVLHGADDDLAPVADAVEVARLLPRDGPSCSRRTGTTSCTSSTATPCTPSSCDSCTRWSILARSRPRSENRADEAPHDRRRAGGAARDRPRRVRLGTRRRQRAEHGHHRRRAAGAGADEPGPHAVAGVALEQLLLDNVYQGLLTRDRGKGRSRRCSAQSVRDLRRRADLHVPR